MVVFWRRRFGTTATGADQTVVGLGRQVFLRPNSQDAVREFQPYSTTRLARLRRRDQSAGVDVALPAGEVAVVRRDYRPLVRPRRERSLVLVRLTVPLPSSEVRDARVGFFTVLAPRVVGVTMHILLPIRVVLVALRSHRGLASRRCSGPFNRPTLPASVGPPGE
jgi:hypothetical protein